MIESKYNFLLALLCVNAALTSYGAGAEMAYYASAFFVGYFTTLAILDYIWPT